MFIIAIVAMILGYLIFGDTDALAPIVIAGIVIFIIAAVVFGIYQLFT